MLAIKNNIMADNAARHLGKSYDALARSVERLSSGLRINSAKDDAAGLAVRELMRADIAVIKQGSSAFFGTHLAALLIRLGVDTLIITGCTTSGCVRATAVDALQYSFRAIVPRECVADRAKGPHEANLFDINQKYGDVVPVQRVIDYLNNLPPQE